MTTTLSPRTPVPQSPMLRAAGDVRHLAVEIRDVPGALVRVLSLLQRRGCRFHSVDFAAGDRHRTGRLVIGITAPPGRGHCVRAWVENLIDVVAAETLD